jgi:hypothetical protein
VAPRVIQAPPDKIRLLRELQERDRRIEAAKLARVGVFAKLEYVPTAKQAEFHEATEFDVLFGGSAGGGKSRALTAEGSVPRSGIRGSGPARSGGRTRSWRSRSSPSWPRCPTPRRLAPCGTGRLPS